MACDVPGRWPHPPYDQRNANTTVQPVTSVVFGGQLPGVAFRRETNTGRPWAAYILIQFERYCTVTQEVVQKGRRWWFLGKQKVFSSSGSGVCSQGQRREAVGWIRVGHQAG